MILLEIFNCIYLRYSEFNVQTADRPDDPVAKLRLKLREQAEQRAQVKSEQQAEQPKQLPSDDEFDDAPEEEEKEGDMVQLRLDVSAGNGIDSDHVPVPYFLDPNTGSTEDSSQRALRMSMWGFLTRSVPNHMYLVIMCVTGDFARLFGLARQVALQPDIPALLGAVTKMTSLRMDKSVSWSAFSTRVMEAYSVISTTTASSLKIGERVLTEFVLAAVESDGR